MNKAGKLRPLGKRVNGSRSSSKNECAHACMGDILEDGVYSNRRETKSIASGGVLVLNTCKINNKFNLHASSDNDDIKVYNKRFNSKLFKIVEREIKINDAF